MINIYIESRRDYLLLLKDKIEEMYKEYLYRYNKLNELFEIKNNPIKMQVLLYNSNRDGYLSYDKNYKYCNCTTDLFIPNALGSFLVTGKGACRNLSNFFYEILNLNNMPCFAIDLNLSNNKIVFSNNKNMHDIKKNGFKHLDIKLFRNIPNHVIIGTKTKDDKTIFLDPLNNDFYYKILDANYLMGQYLLIEKIKLYYGTKINFGYYKTLSDFILINCYHVVGLIKEIYMYNDFGDKKMSLEDGLVYVSNVYSNKAKYLKLKSQMEKDYKDNIDILETFYGENQDFYRELNADINNLRKILCFKMK